MGSLICRYICIFGLLLFACSEKDFDPNNPEQAYLAAKEYYDDEMYEMALQKLGEFKARFPYSKYATEAELLIANSHFELGQYVEAASTYETFAKLHPNHAKADYALFRVGEAHWAEAPEEVDREQDFTKLAVESWEKLLKQKPASTYAAEAKKYIREGNKRIADSYEFIAKFYCKLEIYHACAFRSLNLAEKFPDFPELKREALLRAATAMEALAKIKESDPKDDSNMYFKTMTAAQIKQKANDLKSEAQGVK